MTYYKAWRVKLRLGAVALLGALAVANGAPSSAIAAEKLGQLDARSVLEPLIREESRLTITPGHAKIIRYAREPGTVVVGDATVAIASIVASDILVLTGLRTGETNVIVLDDSGAGIDQIMLRVEVPGDTVVVRRGIERQILRCDPRCAPTDEAGPETAPTMTAPTPAAPAISIEAASAPGL